jgi:glycosyltransferase involved in cell wall biosynthesis
VRNGERFISRALRSGLAQNYNLIEIIVIDDGSTDATASVVEAIAATDRRIQLFQRPHAGVSASRNFAVSQCRGEFIAPLDADDIWHPEKLFWQVAAMLSSPKIGVVYSWAVEIDEDDCIIPPVRPGNTAQGDVLLELVSRAGLIDSGGNSLIRRSCFEAIGGYDASLTHAEDWKLYLSLAQICEFKVVPLYHVGYRRSMTGASRNVARMARGMEAVSNWIIGKLPDVPQEAFSQMIYHRNCYLAHLALTHNQLKEAARYQLEGLKATPQALFSPDILRFGIRLLARTMGVTRRRWDPQSKLVAFKDFP